MLAILYRDENGHETFTISPHKTLDDYLKNTNAVSTDNIAYVFDVDDDLMKQRMRNREHFNDNCHRYGFDETDLNRCFKDSRTGEQYRLIGLIPKNTKYKCLIYCFSIGRECKATIEYVKRMLEENPIDV